jgi:hypothetical protein
MKENLESILTEIVDLLEGGDIVEDFEDNPYAVGIIRSIYSIASNELSAIKATKGLLTDLKDITDEYMGNEK